MRSLRPTTSPIAASALTHHGERSRIAKSEFLFSSHFMERALYSALQPGEEAVELVGEALAVGVVERRRPAGPLPRPAQLVQVVAQRQALLDVLRRIELAARIERGAAPRDHVRCDWNLGGNDAI